jgi:hypothetical protein
MEGLEIPVAQSYGIIQFFCVCNFFATMHGLGGISGRPIEGRGVKCIKFGTKVFFHANIHALRRCHGVTVILKQKKSRSLV